MQRSSGSQAGAWERVRYRDAIVEDTALNKSDLLLLPPVVVFVWAGFLFHSALNRGGVLNWCGAACVLVGAIAVAIMCIRGRKSGEASASC